MNEKEQTYAFGHELDKLVDRFRSEFELTYASIIGTLTMKANLLSNEATEDDADELTR